MILDIYQKLKFKMGYLTQQMTLNTNQTVIAEMTKPFEHIKEMQEQMKFETDWLAKHAEEYDTDEYKAHIAL